MHFNRLALVIALLLSITDICFAQNNDIEGVVLDHSGRPISEATVSVYNCTDTLQRLETIVTSKSGRFVIKPTEKFSNCLNISLSHLGYKSLTLQKIEQGRVNYFILEDIVKVLDEVVIVSECPMVKVEGGVLVYSNHSLQKIGRSVASAYDMLSKLPGVSIEKGMVSLIGMPSTTLVINGRKTLMSYDQIVTKLKAISPEMIERIDIRYDPAPELGSMHSSINIVLKKAPRGKHFQTDLNIGGDFSRRTTTYGNLTVNTNLKSLSVQAHYSYANENYFTNQSIWGKSEKVIDFSELSENNTKGNFHKGYLSFIYPISSDGKQQLGFVYNINHSASEGNIVGNTSLADGRKNIKSQIENNTKASNHIVDLSYTSPRLTMSLQGMSYHTERISQPTITERLVPQLLNQQVYRSGLTIDYNQPVKSIKGLRIIAGEYFRTSIVNNEIQQKITSHEVKSKDIEFYNKTYLGADYTVTKWLTVKGNLIYDLHIDRWIHGKEENRKVSRLYPTASLTFRLPKRNVLMLSYSSELRDPDYWQLTSGLSYISELTRVQGNPSLVPSQMNSLRLAWINKGKYITQFFLQDTKNHITQQLYIDPKEQTATYHSINMEMNRQWGLMTIIPLNVSNNFDLRLTGTVFYLMHRGQLQNIAFDRTKLTGRVAININYSPIKNISCYLDGYYVTPMIQGIYDVSSLHSLDIGVRWFIRKNLSLSLDVQDLLRGKNSTTRANIGNQNYKFTLDNDTRILKLALQWTLGDMFKKNKVDIKKDRIGI